MWCVKELPNGHQLPRPNICSVEESLIDNEGVPKEFPEDVVEEDVVEEDVEEERVLTPVR